MFGNNNNNEAIISVLFWSSTQIKIMVRRTIELINDEPDQKKKTYHAALREKRGHVRANMLW